MWQIGVLSYTSALTLRLTDEDTGSDDDVATAPMKTLGELRNHSIPHMREEFEPFEVWFDAEDDDGHYTLGINISPGLRSQPG